MMRVKRFAVVLGCLGVVGVAGGCEPWHKQALRGDSALEKPTDTVRNDESFARPAEMKGFFNSNRSAGTLSQEARDIEHSLGVGGR